MVIVNWMDDNNVPTSYEAAAEAIAGNNFTVATLPRNEEMAVFDITISVICLVSILINVCIITVLVIGPRAFRTPTFLFLGNLTCGNLINGIVIFLIISPPVSGNLRERTATKGLFMSSVSLAIDTLLFLACERLMKIYHRGKYQKISTNSRAMVIIFGSWLISIGIFLIAPLIGWSCVSLCQCSMNNHCTCDFDPFCSKSFTPFTKAYIASAVIYFYLTFSVIFGIYLTLRKHLWNRLFSPRTRNGKVIIGQVPNYGPFVMVHRRRDIKLAKTLLMVTVTFFVCYAPMTILFLLEIVGTQKNVDVWFHYVLIPVLIHPLICFVIYACRLPRMWSTFKYFTFTIWRRVSCKRKACRSRIVGKSCTKLKVNRHPKTIQSQIPDSRSETTNEISFLNNSYPTENGDSSHTKEHLRLDNNRLSLKIDQESKSVCKNGSTKGSSRKANNVGTSRKITLASGTIIRRDRIEISNPFNAEVKMTWGQ